MPLIRSLILVMGAVLAVQALSFEDPRQFWSQYDKDFQVTFGPQWKDIPLADRIPFLDAQLSSGTHSASDRYLLQRTLLIELRFEGERVRARDLCLAMPVPEEDYETRAACILSRVSSLEEQRQALENLFSFVAREKPGTIFPAAVADKLLDVYWKQNDIAATQSLYNRALELTPLEALQSLIELKESAAVIFSNPSNSPKVIQKALDIFVELEELYRSDPQSGPYWERVVYNRGILRLLALDDAAGALKDFGLLSPSSRNWMDAQIFSAFALTNLGEPKQALEHLRAVRIEDYADSQRRKLLECYRGLTLFVLRQGPEPLSCVNFPADTQSDVLFHVTRYLQEKTLSPAFENLLWRQFWVLYRDRLSPQMHAQIEQYVSSIELQQVKRDSEVKSLELKNFQLIKILFAASLVAVVMIGFLLLRLKRLQTYLHKSVLSRFLPPLMVDEIIRGKSRLESDPHEQLITVLFADMVGFTGISGRIGAKSSAYILNRFMQKISEVIYDHAGTIDKFIGDAVMVIFGAPYQIPAEEQARRSLACAQDMLKAIDELNQDFQEKFGIQMSIRVGINQGEALVGTFGGLKRSDYTAIGPMVNIASRIEGKAQPGQILIGPELASHIPESWLEQAIETELRGLNERVRLYPVRKPFSEALGRSAS